ncbi:MAG: LCP family protein [Micrococcales bacterium]|nr:LCP family protein [Micrococcales bacterium]
MKGTLAVQLRRPARLLATVSAAAILLSSGAGWATVQHYAGQVQRIDAFSDQREAPAPGEPLTFLVVGSDSREGLSDRQVRRLHTGWDVYGKRTDTMMLAHVGADGSVSVVSLPRDSLATIPAYTDENGQSHDASEEKLNSAYAYGGAPLLVQTVEGATGLQIDHYLEVNFAGFVKMVNALGGVDVCVPADIYDPPSGLELPAGRSTLKGRDALAYVRAREFDPTADIGRMKRQQGFIASMVSKAASSAVLLIRPGHGHSSPMLGSMRVDQSLDNSQVMELTRRLANIDPAQVTFRTVPVVGEKPMGAIGNVVVSGRPPSSRPARRHPIPQAACPGGRRGPSEHQCRCSRTGEIASRAYDDFVTAGYSVAAAPVAGTYTQTTIEYDPGYDVSLETLQTALPGTRSVEVPGLGSTFRVTVGPDYTGLTQVSVKDPTQSDQPRTAGDDLCG